MSNIIPFPKMRLTTESRWPYEPLITPRSEDMRVVVEAELNACRDYETLEVGCPFTLAADAFRRATRAMNSFLIAMK